MAMQKPDQPGRFPTTHWSLVDQVGSAEGPRKREALDRLLVSYLPALRAHLLYKRQLAPEQADDFLQEFVATKVLQKDLVARADRRLGRFRTFLLTAVDRFVFNRLRDQRAKKRAPGGRLLSMEDWTGCAEDSPRASAVFDVTWARSVIAAALERMRAECEAAGRADVWGVFTSRIVAPLLEGAEPIDYRVLVERFGFGSPIQAANALTTAKRMYARTLRSVVAEYAEDEQEIDEEIAELREILARGSL